MSLSSFSRPALAGIVEKPEDYFYSSYKSYISGNKKDMVTQNLILGMISKHKRDARKRYRTFVESAIGGEMDNPLEKVYGGMILGRESFIKEILGRLRREDWQKEEVSYRRAMEAALGIEDILDTVCKDFKVSREEILKNESGETRKATIYLIKKHTGATNRQIGELFGGISYSAVAKVYQRFSRQMEEDRRLKRKIDRIDRKMSHVKG